MSKHLVILPCHSIWRDGPSVGESRDEWTLAKFQVEGYDHLCFKDQVEKSLRVLEEDEDATLVISGGQTKKECGPVSEAYSYYKLATKLMKSGEDIGRIVLEEYARDSFENVLFLMCRFFEVNQGYPGKITVVGFEFKRPRFVNNHLSQALMYKGEICYIGNSPTPLDLSPEEAKTYFDNLKQNEYANAVKHFEQDWYGIRGPLLDKKRARNPFSRWHGYAQSNGEMSRFLSLVTDESYSQHGALSNDEIRNHLNHLPWVQ